MIAKILVPHDGTEISTKAFERAIEFAKVFNAEIVLLHIIQDIPIPPSLLLGNDRALISKAKRSIARELEKSWTKMVQEKIIDVFISKDNRIKVKSEVTIGSSPDEEIITFADYKQIDIIIMGSQRRVFEFVFLVSSNSFNVLSSLVCSAKDLIRKCIRDAICLPYACHMPIFHITFV